MSQIMADGKYWLVGQAKIPAEKKKEFNENVLEILNRCGIRKRVKIALAGKSITVLEKPHPDPNGIVSFDYSIFEKKNREVSTFDTNTGVLTTVDRGVGEFGLAMNLILLLQECYSNGSCYFMLNRKLAYIPAYMDMVCTLLNRKLMINSRAKVWDILMLMRENPECDMPDEKELLDGLPWGYCDLDAFQLEGLSASEGGGIRKPEKDPITQRTQIPKATYMARMDYLYRIMTGEYQKDEVKLTNFLKTLLDLPLADRMKLAEEQNDQGTLAELSLYLHPACVVKAFSLLKGKKFWDVWESMEIRGYDDVAVDEHIYLKSNKETEWNKHYFYKQIMRDNQDEFLEFWDGKNLVLSDKMKNRINEWKELFDETEDKPDLLAEDYLAGILVDMERNWFSRYVDKTFVDEVLSHRNIAAWRRTLLVLRKIMDEGMDLFPELDRTMAVTWLKTFRTKYDINAIVLFCSLMENETQRRRIFGF